IGLAGASESTVHVREVLLTDPRRVAFTLKVCGPSGRLENDCGEVQAAKAPASSLHSKSTMSEGVAVNVKLADLATVYSMLAGAASITTVAAVVSTVHVTRDELPRVPNWPIASTENVWLPEVSVYILPDVHAVAVPESMV